jgi:hypothetical protein
MEMSSTVDWRSSVKALRRERVPASEVRTTDEIVQYFDARRRRLKVVKTTRTPRGQVLDWVPVESQVADGNIATAPPRSVEADVTGPLPAGASAEAGRVSFELEDPAVERGPAGTVPVVRKPLAQIHTQLSLADYLSKRRGLTAQADAPKDPPPQLFEPGYFHATTQASVSCFGAETVLNVWDPFVENEGDHSLMQLGIANGTKPKSATYQSLEAGWEVSHNHYGDWDPHLFVLYVTVGYNNLGDNVGGYNQDVDGWVQTDDTIFPASLLAPVSVQGGDQRAMFIKYQLRADGNWWVEVNDRWIGYYPASLFGPGAPDNPGSLSSQGLSVGFWGEVYTTNPSDGTNPPSTRTQMGSGSFGESGWTQACYQRNLRVQSKADGTMVPHAGSKQEDLHSFYDIVPRDATQTRWQSYFYAGGPGNAFLVHAKTPIQTKDAKENFAGFAVGDYNLDGIPDVYAFKRLHTSSHSLEVHVLDGLHNYEKFLFQKGTAITEQDAAHFFSYALGDYDGDGIVDLYCFKRTGTSHLEVHILNGADDFKTFLLKKKTPILQSDLVDFAGFAVGDWNLDGIPDVFGFKVANTGTQLLEIHVLDGASKYQTFSLHTFTPITETDAFTHFRSYAVGGLLNNLFQGPTAYCFKTSNTGTSSLEAHLLKPDNYEEFALRTGTPIPESDLDKFLGFAVGDHDSDGIPDVFCFKAGQSQLEVHVLNGAQFPE